MDELAGYYPKWNKPDRGQIHYAILLICGIQKVQQTSECSLKKRKKEKRSGLTDTENQLVVTSGERGGGGARYR